MSQVLLYSGLIIVSTAVVWKGSDLLESAAGNLSALYGLPPMIHGAVVVAIGSSFPELSSTVLSTLIHGEFELGLSAVVGSAIFNIMVIPGLSGLMSNDKLKAGKDLVYKDALFYIISVAVLLLTFSFAVIYFPEADSLNGKFNRTLAIIPIILYALYLFIQQQETREADQEKNKGDIKPLKQWLFLVLSLVLVIAGVEGLLRSAIFFGNYFNMPSFIWGLTVIAAATSIPDALLSVRMAKKGQSDASLSNVLGSNIFDLLIAVPAGVMIAGSTIINFGIAAPLMGVLTFFTLLLFTLLRTSLVLSKPESLLLLFLYLLFLVWSILEGIGILNWIPD
jgi:cation:H+ antiporter